MLRGLDLRTVCVLLTALSIPAYLSTYAVWRPYTGRSTDGLLVRVEYPGVEAAEIERRIVIPLENAASRLSGVVELRSRSSSGLGELLLRYRPGHDMNTAYLELRELTERTAAGFPRDSRSPRILRSGGSEERRPVFVAAYGRATLGEDPVRNSELEARYSSVEQVALVEVSGSEAEEILLQYDPGAALGAEQFGITAAHDAIIDSAVSFAMSLPNGPLLVLDGRVSSAEELGELSLAEGHTIASVHGLRVAARRPDTIMHLQGSPGMLVYVMAVAEADLIRLGRELRAVSQSEGSVAELRVLYDLGQELHQSLVSLLVQVAAGTGAVVFFLMAMLHGGGPTTAVLPAVGLAVLTPSAVLPMFGVVLDPPVLGAMVLAAGLAADGAAVVLEFETALDAEKTTGRYRGALLYSWLTTVVVFIPLQYAETWFREAFGPFAAALCIGLGAATIYNGLLLPRIVRAHAHSGTPSRHAQTHPLFVLEQCVRRHRKLSCGLAIVVLGVAGVRVAHQDYSLESTTAPGSFTAVIQFPSGTVVEQVAVRAVEYADALRPLLNNQEHLLSRSEPGRLRIDIIGSVRGSRHEEELKATLRSTARPQETVYFPDELLSEAGFEIRINGPNRNEVLRIALEVSQSVSDMDGVKAVLQRFQPSASIAEIQPIPAAMRTAGLERIELARQLRYAMGSGVVAKWYPEAGERDLRTWATPLDEGLPALLELPVQTASGGHLRLGELAELYMLPGMDTLYRHNRVPSLSLTVLAPNFTAEALRQVSSQIPHSGEYFIEIHEAVQRGGLPLTVIIAAVVLVFCVPVLPAGSFASAAWAAAPAPLCFLLSLALVSVVPGPLPTQSLLGAVLGIGLSVNFSLLYMLNSGDPNTVYRACIPATVTTVAGVTPALLGIAGSSVLRPLSLTVAVAGVVSLLILPVWAGLVSYRSNP